MLGKMLRFMTINNDGYYHVVDCGCDLAKILPQQRMVTFAVAENPAGLPSAMQLVSEARAIAATENNTQCLVLINNPRHWIAVIALLLSRTSNMEDFELAVQHLEQKMRVVESCQRDLQVLKTCYRLLHQREESVEEVALYLESIELQPATLTTGETGPFLILLGESETVMVHTANAQRVDDNDTFVVKREVAGGLWIVIRRAAGKRELFRVFIHTALCAANTTAEFTLQDYIIAKSSAEEEEEHTIIETKQSLGQFKLVVRFTETPPPQPEEDEEEEINAAELRLLSNSMCEDEMLAWSLQYEEEASFRWHSPRLSNWRDHNTMQQHTRSLHELPISHYAAVAGTTTGAAGTRERSMCMVCQFPFRVGDELRTLPCFHQFHPTCCDPWFLHKPTCPLCQTAIYSSSSNEPFEQD